MTRTARLPSLVPAVERVFELTTLYVLIAACVVFAPLIVALS